MIKLIIGFVIFAVLFVGATHVFAQPQTSLMVVIGHDMQPFGIGPEDSDTAELHVQGTYSPQVTLHGLFIQGSLNQ